MRVIVLEFLDTDIFHVSNDDCVSFLDPLIARWDIDLSTFDMEVTLNQRLAPGEPRKFAYVEKDIRQSARGRGRASPISCRMPC